MNRKRLIVSALVVTISLASGPAKACVTVFIPLGGDIINATINHLTGGKNLAPSDRPIVRAISRYEPYAMTSWAQGKTTGEFLFKETPHRLVFVGGGAAHYSAQDLNHLYHVPPIIASALVDRFVTVYSSANSQHSVP